MARIRTIKPEFWKSETIASLPWRTRLTFIGLWTYVDDNGAGLDNYKLIAAELFGLEDDPREVRDNTRDSLARLADARLITRYTVNGKRYIRVTNWDEHQRIDRPGKSRHPLPTDEGATILDPLLAAEMDSNGWRPDTSSRHSREDSSTGTGEQGNRGTGEQGKESLFASLTDSATAEAAPDRETTAPPSKQRKRGSKTTPTVTDEEFSEAWDAWPRSDKKQTARTAFEKARALVGHRELLDAIRAYLAYEARRGTEVRYIPHFSTWLNQQRWRDPMTAPDRPGNSMAVVDGNAVVVPGTVPLGKRDQKILGWLNMEI